MRSRGDSAMSRDEAVLQTQEMRVSSNRLLDTRSSICVCAQREYDNPFVKGVCGQGQSAEG